MSALSRQLKALQFAEPTASAGKRTASFLFSSNEAGNLDNATVTRVGPGKRSWSCWMKASFLLRLQSSMLVLPSLWMCARVRARPISLLPHSPPPYLAFAEPVPTFDMLPCICLW